MSAKVKFGALEPSDEFELELSTNDRLTHTVAAQLIQGTPRHPLQQCGTRYVAFGMQSLAYELASAVLSFDRYPTLHTVVLRWVFVVLAAALFDDLPAVDVVAGTGTAQQALRVTAGALVPHSHQRKASPPGSIEPPWGCPSAFQAQSPGERLATRPRWLHGSQQIQ